MTLDVAALKALVGEASVSTDRARQALDETGASAADVESDVLRPLWVLLEERIRQHRPIDAVEVREAVKRHHPEALDVAVDVLLSPDVGVASTRLTAFRDAGLRRRLVVALRAVARASNDGRPTGQLLTLLEEARAGLLSSSGRVRNCAGDALAMVERLESIWTGNGPPVLAMGLGAIDEVVGGLINNLVVLGARTGVGKSAFVAGLVRNWLHQRVRIGVLCYEDDARDMEARLIACEAGVTLKQARGDVIANEWQRKKICEAIEAFAGQEHLLDVDDARPKGSPADVITSIRSMAGRGCRAVVLDNLTCVRMDAATDDRRHDLVVGSALSAIRDEAQHLRIPILVVGHLRRGQSDADESRRPPKLSDFSNASAWENYARVALGMWVDSEGDVCCRVLKQTNGPGGDDFTLEIRREAAVVVGSTRRMAAEKPDKSPRYSRNQE